MLEGEPDIVQEAAEQLQALNPSSPPPFVQKQGYSSQKEERSCFNCGRKGHLIRECRQVWSVKEYNLLRDQQRLKDDSYHPKDNRRLTKAQGWII